MSLNRPPLMSQGQANDFYSYMTIGTGLMWLAGGVAAGPAALALGLCGLGVVANNHRSKGRNAFDPNMKLLPLDLVNASPPPPPSLNDGGLTSAAAIAYVADVEDDLKNEYGISAVYCYRMMVREGYETGTAYETLWYFLGDLKARGYWDKGQIQSGNLTPKQLLDQIEGRRVASSDLQEWLSPAHLVHAIHQLEKQFPDHTERMHQYWLVLMSMFAYVLGIPPITDMPVHRIKVWWDRVDSQGHPLYYVADWDWFSCNSVEMVRGTWENFLEVNMGNAGAPPHLIDEADDLWHYRVEPHYGDGPPGHPGVVLISSVLFGRSKSFPASEDDMRGKP